MDPVAAYIDTCPPERGEALRKVRKIIERAWPGAVADMSAGMPTYHLNGHAFCAFADRKHFMVLHLVHYDLLKVFRHELMLFDHGRSCIRFTQASPQVLDMLDRVVKYCGNQMATSIHYGRMHKMRGPAKRSS